MFRASPLVLSILAASLAIGAERQHWVAAWGASQAMVVRPAAAGPARAIAQPKPAAGPQRRFPIPPSLPNLDNQTVRMVVRASLGGRQFRVRLSNAIGAAAVKLGSAHLARRAQDSAIVPGTDRALTFGGQTSATMYPGQTLVSDPVSLDVPALTDLAVSLYFPSDTGTPTSHRFGLHTTYVSSKGDLTAAVSIPDAAKFQSYYWLAGIDVLAPQKAATLVTFGDSITDGDQSTDDTNSMWPAVLAARLHANKSTSHIGVVNAGIAGNRVLGEGGALSRLYHDVLSQPGLRWIMLLEGINDITGNRSLSADYLIAAYRQIIAAAHLHGVKAIGCTITPYGGSRVFNDAGESIRQAVNAWIRTPGNFDAFVDFDAATRDARDPRRFRVEADSPDLLHPGDAGYKLMGEAVPLSIFK